MSIVKWKIYCNVEQIYITCFFDYGIEPCVCSNNNNHSIDKSKTKFLERIYIDNTKDLIKWKVFCDTEQIYTYGYLEAHESPERCFNNKDHIISKRPEIIDKIINNTVRIREESLQTGGNFKATNRRMICPPGESVHDFCFDIPLSALSMTLVTSENNRNHLVKASVGPDTVIGVVTQNVSISDKILYVSSSVLENINIGYGINLYDGDQMEDLGIVTGIQINDGTVSVSKQSSKNFSINTYIRMSVYIVDDFTIGYPSRYEIGKDKIGGSYVPASTIIRVQYNNIGLDTVDFYVLIEYLY